MTPTIEEFEELVDEATGAAADIVSALECGHGLVLAFKRAGITRAAVIAAFAALVKRNADLEELNASYYRALQRAGDYIEQLEEAAT